MSIGDHLAVLPDRELLMEAAAEHIARAAGLWWLVDADAAARLSNVEGVAAPTRGG
jgi:hypothetical protein